MRSTEQRSWVWVSVVASTAAVTHGCSGPEGTWHACSSAAPGTQTRRFGTQMQCLCEPGWICNYNSPPDAPWPDASIDAAWPDDAGPAEAGSAEAGFAAADAMEDAAIDAFVIVDDAGPANDAAIDAVVSADDAGASP